MTNTTMNTANTETTTTTEHASGLHLDVLGSTIRAHISNAEKYEGKAHENRMAAGLHLIEAKARIAAGEYGGKFGLFLQHACKGLGESRAYELIAIASGKTTQEEHRAQANVRKQRYRAKAAEAGLRSGTESAKAEADELIAELRATAPSLAERRRQAEADAAAIRARPGYKPTPEPRRITLRHAIEVELKWAAEVDLERMLKYLKLQRAERPHPPEDLDAAAWQAEWDSYD
jgi:hypothetical protein